MDALTALSVASTIITFVDFAGKLLSDSRKLYKSASGVLSPTIDIEILTLDLSTITQGLKRKLPEHRLLSSPLPGSHERTEDDEALDRLCVRCVDIADTLRERLERLKVKPKKETSKDEDGRQADEEPRASENTSKRKKEDFVGLSTARSNLLVGKAVEGSKGRRFGKWESFRKALEAAWSKSEIEELVATLRDFRSEIEFRILVSLRGALNGLATQQSDLSRQLTQSTQLILGAFLNTRDELANELRLQAEKVVNIRAGQLSNLVPKGAQEIENYLRGELNPTGTFESSRDAKPPGYSEVEISPRELQIEQELQLLMAENGILGSLSFATMTDRQSSLEKPLGQTFQWIYEAPESSDRPWSNFVQWLREEEGIYWVNGKIGSGKSTLMRYIYQNGHTRKELQEWANGFPVEISGFFFWNSGDDDQKSQSGLLKSLLFDILQRHRDLLPEIMPEAWSDWSTRAAAVISSKLPLNSPFLPPEPKSWTMPQLHRAFIKLLEVVGRRVKLCLFIDGLDEYMGEYLDIIELFQECAELPNIKLCVSSRPLLAFEQAFGGLPGLRLQDLTRGDIHHYVKSRLYSHKYMAQLSQRHAADMSLLINEIVTKSRGVFLWVKLVVKSLLQGLCDRNRMSDLKRRVEYLPEDLESLYAHILKRIDPFYYTQTSKLFQIVRLAKERSPDKLTLLNLSWADEDDDEEIAEDAPILPLTDEEITFRCQTMDARLKSVCAGLLESNDVRFSSIQPDSRVMFLHRTVADWLAKLAVWNDIVSRTSGTGFSPNLALLKSCVLNLKGTESSARAPLDMNIVFQALDYAKSAEDELGVAFPKLLDQLDIAVAHHWRSGDVSFSGNGRYSEFNHWSYGIHVPGKPAGTTCTFYDLAHCLGLTHYAAAKYGAGVVVDQEVNQHLLVQAIPSVSGVSHAGAPAPDPELVERILQSGTSPNYATQGMTPWEGVLLDAAWHFGRAGEGGGGPALPRVAAWRRTAEAWARVIRAFVEHGADPDVVTRRHPRLPGHPRLTPERVLGTHFPEFLAAEAAQLRRVLQRTRERNARLKPVVAVLETEEKEGSDSSSDAGGVAESHSSFVLVARWIVSWFRVQ